MAFLQSAAQSGVALDVFDAHDELGHIPGATACKLSQATCYGYNPLVLSTDLHTGGVNRQGDFFVQLIRSVSPQFGVKQEGALRYLLHDTYAASGIRQNDPATWDRKSLTDRQRQALLKANRSKELRLSYPTLEDLQTFTRHKIIALTLGGDNVCATAFENLTRLQRRLTTLQRHIPQATSEAEEVLLTEQIGAQKKRCILKYTEFIEAMETGREIDDVLKYDSVDVLTSILQRLALLSATGILSANEPPFGSSRLRVHMIKSISHEQQVLYVKLRLLDIFEQCKRQGATPTGNELRRVVFLDEAHKYFSTEPDDIINVVAKEGRKFGLGLWCASQQPTAFPEYFLTNVGATILLGIHTSYWKRASSMFRIAKSYVPV